MLHWYYHRERHADTIRGLRRHLLAEIHPRERRLPLVRLTRRARGVPARTFRIA